MKLFLSSVRLPNKNERAELFGDKKHVSVLIIPNAWDTYPEDRQKAELASTLAEFQKRGYHTSVLDLVTSSDKQRREALGANNILWIMGGNSFYLNYLIRKTGFDALLKDALNDGLIYGGASAGAVVACPTLHGAQNADDPNDAPQILWDGLALVEFGVVPHWGMKKYAGKLAKMAAEMAPFVPQLVKITNEQAILVIDGQWKVS